MTLTLLHGPDDRSEFRRADLLRRIQIAAPALRVLQVDCQPVYLLEGPSNLWHNQQSLLRALLKAEGELPLRCPQGFYILPRRGTISPWSSKATDIFHHVGLTTVRRVEHGRWIRLMTSPSQVLSAQEARPVWRELYDRMTESIEEDLHGFFDHLAPAPLTEIDLRRSGIEALREANRTLGLALSEEEIAYLYDVYRQLGRNPTDVELVMFGQVNSEHCRHKIFRAEWVINGRPMPHSLFDMIRNTHKAHPAGTLLAYEDNAAVIEGFIADAFETDPTTHCYVYRTAPLDLLMKVETHNHPTAISPYPGAATGVGGEIRDEAATGIGGRSVAGLSAFMVSHLRIPGFGMPWETPEPPPPDRLATALEIMIEGPIGGARFGNEFGRPQLAGIFKCLEIRHQGRYYGYHKPVMVAGGMGWLHRIHHRKKPLRPGDCVVQIGGPALRIGLGGGAASSMASGANPEHLDFDSVQRDNAEMQRRCQEVINACIALGEQNPILSIHDVGAGGLSNACPELVAETGGRFWLRRIPNEEPSMSPMEIWCCEAQERYVLAVPRDRLDEFMALCRRERCPVAWIGETTGDHRLILEDEHFGNRPIDIEVQTILGRPPRMRRTVDTLPPSSVPLKLEGIHLEEAVERVLRFHAVANKTFLITIADRSVTGLVARDQMVGPYQTPIADVAVTALSYHGFRGQAMAMGERTALAIISGPASGRMAVAEALTNIAAAAIGPIGRVKLSANWMCACGEPDQDAALYETVRAVAMDLCPRLGISIPVGKDSLSMRTIWTVQGREEKMIAPLTLVISAFAPVEDIRKTVTPDLKPADHARLLLLDLGAGKNRLGGSTLAQVYGQVGDVPPDLDEPERLVAFFTAIQELIHEGLLLAYHDRSDGGLFVTLAEMAFGGPCGLSITLDHCGPNPLASLFAEEVGAVLQVDSKVEPRVMEVLARHGLIPHTINLGSTTQERLLEIRHGGHVLFRRSIPALKQVWSELTREMQARRDNPTCAAQEFNLMGDERDPGLSMHPTYNPDEVFHIGGRRPRVAILREQGVNGHVEMAAAFDAAGFEAVDVHMTDLLAGRCTLDNFHGLVACGGFSYGDVLGAGSGWALSILYNERLRDLFQAFFARPDTFSLGVCNGCQMLAQLKDLIPGAECWPRFTRNRSEQFEARYVLVEVLPSPSIFLRDMAGSRLGIAVAHGEGFADFRSTGSLETARTQGLIALRYVDHFGQPTEIYPLNPNGSPEGITALTSLDGRATIMMPHPERGFRAVQMSYRPPNWPWDAGPWLRMFQNARRFVG